MNPIRRSPEKDPGIHLLVGFRGQTFEEELKALVHEYCIGGIVLFKRNIEAPEQLRCLLEDAQAFARESLGRRLWVAVDQEGGPVQRLGPGFFQLPSAHELGVAGAAIATSIGNMVGFGLAVASLLHKDGYLRLTRHQSWKPDRAALSAIGKVSGNAVLEQMVLRFGFFTFARVVAALGILHLDDVGAEIGQQLSGPRAGEDARQFDDADAFERWFGHGLPARLGR